MQCNMKGKTSTNFRIDLYRKVIDYWTTEMVAFDKNAPLYEERSIDVPIVFPNVTIAPDTKVHNAPKEQSNLFTEFYYLYSLLLQLG